MSDKYVAEVSRVVVAHLARHADFDSITSSSLDVLFELMAKYVEELGYSAHLYANIAGRTQVNMFDALAALHERTINLEDLFVMYNEATSLDPLPKQISNFPVPDHAASLNELRDPPEPLPEYVPKFLPPFPDKHTYIATPATDDSIEDLASIRKARNKRKRQVEESLFRLSSLQQSLSGKTSSPSHPNEEDQHMKSDPLSSSSSSSSSSVPLRSSLSSSSSSLEPPLKNPYMQEPIDPSQIQPPKPTKAPNPERFAPILRPKEVVESKPRMRVDREDDADRQRKQNKLHRILETKDPQSATKLG